MKTKFNLDAEMNKILLSNTYQQYSKPLSKKASAEDLKHKEILNCLKDLHDVCKSLEDSDQKDVHKKCLKSIKELVSCCKSSEEIQAWAEKHGYLEDVEDKDQDDEGKSEEQDDDNKSDDSFEFEVSLD